MKNKYSFLSEEYTAKDFKNDLRAGIKKTIKGAGYIMQKTGSVLEKNSKKVSKYVEKGTNATLKYSGKGIKYVGDKLNKPDKG